MTRFVPRAFVVVALLAAAACRLTPPQYAEADLPAASERILWQVCVLSMQRNNFPPSAKQDRAGGRLVSGWRTSLQPFKGQGHRERCEILYQQADEGKWSLSVRVEKETNEELARPLDPAYAQWKGASDDAEAAARVLGTIRLLLESGEANGKAR